MDRITALARSFLDMTIVDGVAADVDKAMGRALFSVISSAINTLSDATEAQIVQDTLVHLNAISVGTTAVPFGTAANVVNDGSNNGQYVATSGGIPWVYFAPLSADTTRGYADAAAASATSAATSATSAAGSLTSSLAVEAYMLALQSALGGIPGIVGIGTNSVRRWQFMAALGALGATTFANARAYCETDESNRLTILWQSADVVTPGDVLSTALVTGGILTSSQMTALFTSAATQVMT